jgi:hypothetical protein
MIRSSTDRASCNLKCVTLGAEVCQCRELTADIDGDRVIIVMTRKNVILPAS